MPRPPTEDDIRRIYGETIADLYAFVSRRCDGDRDLAEDVTQEAWLRAVRAWAADGLPDRPLGWLNTVAARQLATHFRRPDLRRVPSALETLSARDEEASRDATERRSLVERALARLPRPQARLLEAFHLERHPIADIAANAGISERAVEGRLRRARRQLRHQIESEGEQQ